MTYTPQQENLMADVQRAVQILLMSGYYAEDLQEGIQKEIEWYEGETAAIAEADIAKRLLGHRVE